MTQPGSFRIASRQRSVEARLDSNARGARRVRKILESLLNEIQDDETLVRVRRVFATPREIFRLEIESPVFAYQRTTLLDRDALEVLLATDAIRQRLRLELE